MAVLFIPSDWGGVLQHWVLIGPTIALPCTRVTMSALRMFGCSNWLLEHTVTQRKCTNIMLVTQMAHPIHADDTAMLQGWHKDDRRNSLH